MDRRRFLLAAALVVEPACHRRSSTETRPRPGNAKASPFAPTAAVPRVGPLHPERLERFVDALPLPKTLAPEGTRSDPRDSKRQLPYFRVVMQEVHEQVHRDLPATRFWSYGESMPSATIEVQSGQPVLVEWQNRLPEQHFLPIDHTLCGASANQPQVRTVVHVHGARVPPECDGNPEEWFATGQSRTYRYPNQQEAMTLWYHDHAMGIERLNHYAGMFGMFLVRDELEAKLSLPKGVYEIPLMICDRSFDENGQLSYPVSGIPGAPWVEEVFGDVMLLNGKLFPYLEVEPRSYRFRVVNSANARFLYLSLSNRQSVQLIGSDQGFLAAPAMLKEITLGPAERADLIIDFSNAAGTKLVLMSQTFELMQFRVGQSTTGAPTPLPAQLRPIQRLSPTSAKQTRLLTLNQYRDLPVAGRPTCSRPPTADAPRMLMLLNGTRWLEPVTEKPELGTVEIWSFINLTEDTHPIHLHLVRFQILDRQQFDEDEYLTHGTLNLRGKRIPPAPDEAGWKDTVRADSGVVTRIIIRFEDFVGRYVWHCHLLEHAANEMMRPYEIVGPGTR